MKHRFHKSFRLFMMLIIALMSQSTFAKFGFGLMPQDSKFPSIETYTEETSSKHYSVSVPVVNGQISTQVAIDAPQGAVVLAMGMPQLKLNAQSLYGGMQALPTYTFQGENLTEVMEGNTWGGFFDVTGTQAGIMSLQASGIPKDKKVVHLFVKQPSSKLSLKTSEWPLAVRKGEEFEIKAELSSEQAPLMAKLEAVLPDGKIVPFTQESTSVFKAILKAENKDETQLHIQIKATGYTSEWASFMREENVIVTVVEDESLIQPDVYADYDLNLYVPVITKPGRYKMEIIYGQGSKSIIWAQKVFAGSEQSQTIKIAAPKIKGHEDLLFQSDKALIRLVNIESGVVVDKTLYKLNNAGLTL